MQYLHLIKGKRVLVTGGLGFVGHNLVKSLLNDYGCSVVVVDNCANSSTAVLGDSLSKVEFHQISVLDSERLFPLLHTVDYIFHLACIQIAASSSNPLLDLKVNAESTLNILDYIKTQELTNIVRFIYTSSCSIYGVSANNFPSTEDGAMTPLSHYASTKLLGENYTMVYHRSYNIPTSSVRYSNVYGYGQSPRNPYCGVLGKFVHNALIGEPCLIIGDGEQTRDYTFISDAVSATILSAVHPAALGEVFNIGTGVETSVNRLFDVIHENIPTAISKDIPERDIDNIRRRVTNIEKIHQRLGWTPQVTIKKGIAETLNWYKSTL
ncbi:MAG: NAD-dependent epimerase/dehydratase family protein [Bacteroidota bacterium]